MYTVDHYKTKQQQCTYAAASYTLCVSLTDSHSHTNPPPRRPSPLLAPHAPPALCKQHGQTDTYLPTHCSALLGGRYLSIMMIKAGRRRILPRCKAFLYLKLMLVGFVVISFSGSTAGDEELPALTHGYVRQRNIIGLLPDDYTPSGFIQGNRDVGAPAPLASKPGGGTAGSRATTAHRHLEDVDFNHGERGGW